MLAASPAASGQTATGDSVTAEATVGFGQGGTWGFLINAHSGPSGEARAGTITANNLLFGSFNFTVTCLTVSGNRAAMFGPPVATWLVPSLVEIAVEDNDGTA